MGMDQFAPDTALALINSTSAQTARATERLKDAANDKRFQQIEQAAEDFEAVFLSEMMKPMFESVEVDSNFGGGKGEEVFRSFMLQEYGKMMAASGQVGMAEQVKAELIKMQSGLGSTSTGTEIAKTLENLNELSTTAEDKETP